MSELRKPGIIHCRHPWVWRQPPPQPISICKALEGTVQVGGRAQASPFCPTMGSIFLSCANCPCALGVHKPKLLLRKPSPSYRGSAQGSPPSTAPQPSVRRVAEPQGAGQMGTVWCWSAVQDTQGTGVPGDSFPLALTGERLPCVQVLMAATWAQKLQRCWCEKVP